MSTQQNPLQQDTNGQWWFAATHQEGWYGPYADEATGQATYSQYLQWLQQNQIQPQAQQAPEEPQLPAEVQQAAARYKELRNQKSAIDAKAKAEAEGIKGELQQIEGYLLNFLNTSGLKNFGTDDATVYTEVTTQYQIGDKGALMQFIRDRQLPELLQARIASDTMKQYLENGNQLPPGVSAVEERVVRVRAK